MSGADVRSGDEPPFASLLTASGSELDSLCLGNLLDEGSGIYFFKDLQGRFVRTSRDCAALAGRTPEQMVGLSDYDLTDADHARELEADERRIVESGRPLLDKEEIDRLGDKSGTWVETSKFALRDANGRIVGTFGFSRDVTRWEQAEAELSQSNARLRDVQAQLRIILETSTDGIAQYDRELRYRFVNPTGERWRGRSFAELEGRTDREVGIPEPTALLWEGALRRVLDTGQREELEVPGMEGLGGEGAWFHIVLTPEFGADGATVGVLTSGRDITALKHAEQALNHQARHDHLTGLANRALMDDRLRRALARLDRHAGVVAVYYIDLDDFKEVNDRLGHAAGDQVIVEAARRLESLARRQDTVARMGGDEFIMVCEMDDPDGVRHLAGRVVDVLAVPLDLAGDGVRVSASVGAAMTRAPDTEPEALIREADQAMYRAKSAGRNQFAIADTATASDT